MRQKFAKLVKDDTPMVRWGAAQAMAVICHALDQEMITEFLLPLLKELLQDKNDSVKVHAVQSSVVVCELIADADVIHQSIVPSLKQAFQNKQSWRLRFAVAENAAKIGQRLWKAHVDTSILPFYVTLLGDSEPEVRSESVNKLADLAVNCTTSLIVQTLLPKLKLQLARHGVPVNVETLRSGIVLPDREANTNKHEKRYLKGYEFLPVNEHAKKKDKLKSRKGARGSVKRAAKSKSPGKKKRGRKGSYDDDDDDF